jgi:hypothetical protein
VTLLALAQERQYVRLLEALVRSRVHRGAGKADAGLYCPVPLHRSPEYELPVCVSGVEDAKRLVNPAGEVADELDDTRNGRAGVDESECVVMSAATMREDGAVVAAAE